ncbi:MAG TPA: serine hydrolase domain-containing protein [Chitinophagaceae bacterium]
MKTPSYILLIFFICACQASADRHDGSPNFLLPATKTYSKSLSNADSIKYANAAQDYYNMHLGNRRFNGGMVVAKNGVIVFEKYEGFKDLRSKDTLTAQTPFHIASTSKTITGMAILRLVQQGKIKLDDSLTHFFPQVAYKGITIEMLLSHRSGLPNYLYYFESNGWDRNKMLTNNDVLQSLFTTKAGATSRPGTRFQYCNTNFVLLALVIEKASGMSYAQFLQKEFFDPLQMNNTYVYSLTNAATATPSFNANGSLWKLDQFDLTYGDKNIYSTPRDLLKWDRALSNGEVINEALLDSAYMPRSNEKRSIHNYGLAWRMLLLPNGKKVIYHNGRWHGFNAMFARLIEDDATIIILGNRYNSNIYEARKMYDIFGNYYGNGSDDEEDDDAATTAKSVVLK